MARVLTEEQRLQARLRQKRYAERHKEKVLLASKKWNQQHKEKMLEAAKRHYDKKRTDKDFREKQAKKTRLWAKNNPHKVVEQSARKRAARLQRCPKWLSEEHKKEICLLYKKTQELSEFSGTKFHVDHIIPLRGKEVSGLHVPWNMRVVTAIENMEKSNKLTEF